ncbi:outer membrane efflux protein [Rhodovulum bhavnagarense]|uniref:Outer membrane efflux protein n=1 Tax=Rhodovulum bhavnagarense TaxID=992286 RepID=A0A4R2RFI4_9RHOB|nr:outer membrane efflux protein [Rhodovulum bhavnagarense]
MNGATAEALAARAERVAQGNALALEAARAWIDTWQFDARLRLLRSRTDEMNRLIAQIERMASNGMIDRGALESARHQVIDIALEQTRLEADLNEARVRYARFFNRPLGQPARPSDLASSPEVRTAAKSWQQSPQLHRAAAELIVAQTGVERATAAFRPRARFQAGVTSPMEQEESTDLSVGLVLEYTFGDGGRRRSELDSARARHAAAEAQLADAQRALKAEIDASLDQLDAIERSMPLVARQITLSASEAKTARSQIATGQTNLRQLIEAEIENYRAQDRHIAMQAERQILLLTICDLSLCAYRHADPKLCPSIRYGRGNAAPTRAPS